MAESRQKRQAADKPPPGAQGEAGRDYDPGEAAHFDALWGEAHNPRGPLAALHRLNPARLQWLKSVLGAHFSLKGAKPLSGLRILDVGCGAGILTAPLARLGAAMVGIDIAPRAIAEAQTYAQAHGLNIDFRNGSARSLLQEGAQFDAVLAMEVLEHVPQPEAFIAQCAALARPGGLVAGATLNRTWESWLFAIIGAEYVMRLVPAGTHHYEKLITPEEMRTWFAAAGLAPQSATGMVFNPWNGTFTLSDNMRINYMMAAGKPED